MKRTPRHLGMALLLLVVVLLPMNAYAEKVEKWTVVYTLGKPGARDIYVYKKGSKKPKDISRSTADDHAPSCSPKGKKILFVSNRAEGIDQLYVMSLSGGNVRALTAFTKESDIKELDHPRWSPDGKKIVFQAEVFGGAEIYLMDVSGANLRRLTNNKHTDIAPSFSPDSKKILFESNREHFRHLYTMDVNGGNVTQLTKGNANHMGGSWSPDGNTIIFNSDGYRNAGRLYLLDVKTEKVTHVLDTDQYEQSYFSNASWGSKSKRVIIARDELRKGSSLWMLSIDGSRLTEMVENGYEPTWCY